MLSQRTVHGDLKKTQLEKGSFIRAYLEGLFILAHFISPVLPITAEKIFKSLGHPLVTLPKLKDWNNLTPGATVVGCGHLFERVNPNKYYQKQAKTQGS